jgi:hypothetical protein
MPAAAVSWSEAFATAPDPRAASGRRYPLTAALNLRALARLHANPEN